MTKRRKARLASSAVVFAWWFLAIGPRGGFSAEEYHVVGPFDSKEDCSTISAWVHGRRGVVTECWKGEK